MINSRNIKFSIVIGFGAIISGCATNQTPIAVNTQAERGAAVKAALAKQIVNPNAVAGAPTLHPEKAAAALERYLNDEVKMPESAEEIVIVTGN